MIGFPEKNPMTSEDDKNMKQNILVGSIIAVTILISLSFTSVIGYITIKSDPMSSSPLFNVRINKAIGEESKVIFRQYFSEGSTLWFPKCDDEAILTQKIVDSISKMDDETFEKSIAFLINSILGDKRFFRLNSDGIREAFYLLRNNDKSMPLFEVDTGNTIFGYDCTIRWPFCIIKYIFELIGILIIWCFGPPTIGFTSCACGPTAFNCPRTLQKLL